MKQQQAIFSLIKALVGQSNILTIPRLFIDLTGDIDAALFLSQCIYWSDKTDNPKGFYKPAEEWQNELGFGHSRLTRCIKRTARWVGCRNHRANGMHVRHFNVNMECIAKDLEALVISPPTENADVPESSETTKPVVSETTKPVISEPTNLVGSETTELVSCLTETTPKTTQHEITQRPLGNAMPSGVSVVKDAKRKKAAKAPRKPKPPADPIHPQEGDPPHVVFIKRYYLHLGYPCLSFGAEVRAASSLLKFGYTVEQAIDCWDWLKEDKFWGKQSLPLRTLATKIGEFVKRGKNGNGAGGKRDAMAVVQQYERASRGEAKRSEADILDGVFEINMEVGNGKQ